MASFTVRVKLSEAEVIIPLEQGGPIWQPEGIMVGTVDLWETRMDTQGPMASISPT